MLCRRLGRRALVLCAGAAIAAPTPLRAREASLRFAVGPFLPMQSDTRKAFEPFFRHVAEGLGRPYELIVLNDWAGIAVALANGQVDLIDILAMVTAIDQLSAWLRRRLSWGRCLLSLD